MTSEESGREGSMNPSSLARSLRWILPEPGLHSPWLQKVVKLRASARPTHTGFRAVPSGLEALWESPFPYSCSCLQPGQYNMTMALPLGTILADTVNILMQKGFLQITAASPPSGRLANEKSCRMDTEIRVDPTRGGRMGARLKLPRARFELASLAREANMLDRATPPGLGLPSNGVDIVITTCKRQENAFGTSEVAQRGATDSA